MSSPNVQQAIRRAVTEPNFRQLLLRDPGLALAGYDLTEAEVAAITTLKSESFDGPAAELEARLSRGFAWGS